MVPGRSRRKTGRNSRTSAMTGAVITVRCMTVRLAYDVAEVVHDPFRSANACTQGQIILARECRGTAGIVPVTQVEERSVL